MSEEDKKTHPDDLLKEVKEKDHKAQGHDVSEMAADLEGKIPTEKKKEE